MKKIVFTGPESVGKSTLTKQIAEYYKIPAINEIARQYLETKNYNYKYNLNDVFNIAKLQIDAEEKLLKNNEKIIVLDTDLIVTKIWFLRCYNFSPPWIDEYIKKNSDSFHLLAYPDIEWQFDPVRENPDIRLELFDEYKNEIENFGFDYQIITGKNEIRLQNAINAIKHFFN